MRDDEVVVIGLEIAGTAFRLDCDDAAFSALLTARYAGFAPQTTSDVSLRIAVAGRPSDDAVAAWPPPYARFGGRGDELTIEGPGFDGVFDEARGHGAIRQPADPAPLESLLTAIALRRLLARGGVLLHAAAILRDGHAFVFFGPSGSGKTTATELVGEGVLTDEITAIQPGPGGYVVSSVPWRGRAWVAPLAGLYRLRHAVVTSFTRFSPGEALRQLLSSVFFARTDTNELAASFEAAFNVARAVPAWDMGFTRDRGFWDAVPRAA